MIRVWVRVIVRVIVAVRVMISKELGSGFYLGVRVR